MNKEGDKILADENRSTAEPGIHSPINKEIYIELINQSFKDYDDTDIKFLNQLLTLSRLHIKRKKERGFI